MLSGKGSTKRMTTLPSCDSLPIPCNPSEIPTYTSYKVGNKINVDGNLQEKAWNHAERSRAFVDLITGESTMYRTQAAVLWDQDFLYVAYWIEEPNVWATLTERDAPIYRDNDVELFIAGENAYYEFEINALGTIYEVFFIWKSVYESAGFVELPEFDTEAPLVKDFHGVGFKPHPRGPRIGFWNWDLPQLKTAVQVQGTLNDSTDIDQGWTVEIAIPWAGLKPIAIGSKQTLPPLPGSCLRMDFSRFNQYREDESDSGGWAWSSHGVWDSHVPECFTRICFSEQPVGVKE